MKLGEIKTTRGWESSTGGRGEQSQVTRPSGLLTPRAGGVSECEMSGRSAPCQRQPRLPGASAVGFAAHSRS